MVNDPQGLKMMKLFEDQEEKGPGRVDFLRDMKYRLVCAWLVCLSLPRFGKITLYWNRMEWFLIFLSIVDKNIKFTTICI